MKNSVMCITAMFVLTVLSCRSVPPATGPAVWDSVTIEQGEEYTTAYLVLSGRSRNVLSGPATRNGDGSWTVEAEELQWFSNWHEGWSEAVIMVTGTLRLTNTGSGWQVQRISPVRTDYAAQGAIRYRDTRLTGDAGTDAVSRRLNRISAAVAFLSEALDGEQFTRFTVDSKKVRESSFEYRAGRLLFPEQYGYPEGTEESTNGREYNRGEGLRWDTGYTELYVPETLHDVRNSGTLYRDWEETGELFYYMYTLENLNE